MNLLDVSVFDPLQGITATEEESAKRLKTGDPMMEKFQDMMINVLAKQQAQFNSSMQQQMLMAQQQQQALMVEFFKHNMGSPKVEGVQESTLPAVSTATVAEEPKDATIINDMLKKEKNKFHKKVKTFLRSEDTLKQRKGELDMMESDNTFQKMPGFIKPFKAPGTEAELDDVWSKCTTEDFVSSFTFPKGTTRRRALELMHWAMVKNQKSIFVESAACKVETMKVASRKASFTEACNDSLNKIMSTDDASNLGLDGVSQITIDRSWFNTKVEDTYKLVVEGAIKEKKADDANVDAKKKKFESINEEMEKLKPEEVIANFVDKRVKDLTCSGFAFR